MIHGIDYDKHSLGGLNVEEAIDRALENDDGDRLALMVDILQEDSEDAATIRDALSVLFNANCDTRSSALAVGLLHSSGSRAVRARVIRKET